MIFLKADLESWGHKDFKNIYIIFVPQNLSGPTQEVTVCPEKTIFLKKIIVASVIFGEHNKLSEKLNIMDSSMRENKTFRSSFSLLCMLDSK